MLWLASSNVFLGQLDEARIAHAEAQRRRPGFTVEGSRLFAAADPDFRDRVLYAEDILEGRESPEAVLERQDPQ